MSEYFHQAAIGLPILATWIWTRGRKVFVIVIFAALVLLLAHMTPPVMLHAQHIHLAPSDQAYRPSS